VLGTSDQRGCCQYVTRLKKDQHGNHPTDVLPAAGEIPDEAASPRIIRVDFAPLPADPKQRARKMAENDSFLHAVLSTVGRSKYTVIYVTTPASNPQSLTTPQYEMDHQYDAALHTELKRDVGASHDVHAAVKGAPLFEKYVFLSSGKDDLVPRGIFY